MRLCNDVEIAQALSDSEWQRERQTIVREVRQADFSAAMAFVNRVAALAEEADHHPDILIHAYNHVRLTLATHSAGGITTADLALAARIDALG